MPLTHLLLDAPSMREKLRDLVRTHRPDVVLALCSGMARFGMEPPLADVPLVVDMIDVDSLKWRLLADRTSAPKRWIYLREARTLSRFEGVVSRRAYASVVVNERERRALTALAPSSRVDVIQMGIDLRSVAPLGPPVSSTDVVFCGVMSYPPNEEAVLWLANRVWPIVQRQHRQARLKIIGSSPTARVRALANSERRIEVTGPVPDVRPHLWSAAVSVAPVLAARGTQTKVFEAVGAGLPSVITSVVADGLPAELLPACTVADRPDAFAAAILECLALSPIQRRAAAWRVDLTGLEWHRCLAPYRRILECAIHGSHESPPVGVGVGVG